MVGPAGLHPGLVGILAPGQDGVHRGRVIGRALEKEGALAEVTAVVYGQEHLSIGNEYVAAARFTEGVARAFIAVPEGVVGPVEAISIAIGRPGAGDVLGAGDDDVFTGETGDGEHVAGRSPVSRDDRSVVGAFSDDDGVTGSSSAGLDGAVNGLKGLGLGAGVGIIAACGIDPEEVIGSGVEHRADGLAGA